LGRSEECRRYAERALEVAERVGNPVQIAFVLGNLGETLTRLGEWKEARKHLERAVSLLGEQRTPYAPWVPMRLGELALVQGRWEESERIAGEGLALAQKTGQRGDAAKVLRAELDVRTGRPQEAVRRLEALFGVDDERRLGFPILAWAYVEVGAVEQAEQLADEAVRRVRAEAGLPLLLWWLEVQGRTLARQGRFEEAAVALQEGLELARSLSYPYDEARILEALGRREEALALFRRLGASKDIERVERELLELDRSADPSR
jgi:tetratricopeptide (TPR) repeat protein